MRSAGAILSGSKIHCGGKRMRRVLAVLAVVFGLLFVTGVGSAHASPMPTGCKTTPPTIAKVTQNGTVGIVVTAPPITCSAASGYTFVSATIGAQIETVSFTGSVTYHNSTYW